MRLVWTFGGGLASAATLGIIALALSSATPASPPQDTPLPDPLPSNGVAAIATGFVPRGAGSCASQACHGGTSEKPFNPSPILRNEYTTWITRDPHAQAYDVLSNARSVSIAKNLKIPSAETDARCLACHASPSLAQVPVADRSRMARDGVSCESCHGASSRWASEHVSYDWASKSADQKEKSGFCDLRDLARRAEVCAGCHIGAPAKDGIALRDVNHDLIAAGHPRLTFEYSAYVANYPKHWVTKGQPLDMDARLWKIGQVASLRAAVDLLHERSSKTQIAPKVAPWPELAEYSCFSCHFALKDTDPKAKSFRGLRDQDDPGPIGVPSWNSWHLPMMKALAKGLPNGAPPEVVADLARLRKTMSTFEADPAVVARESLALRASLDRWLPSLKQTPVDLATIRSLQAALNDRVDGRRALVTSWDSAAQLYLALAALNSSQAGMNRAPLDPKAKDELRKMLEELGFPAGFDAPRSDFHPARLP